jgi:hypothetical protein
MKKYLVLENFPTHAPTSKSYKQYIKINGNRIYSGMQHYTRSFVVNFMKDYIKSELPEDFSLNSSMFPITIDIVLCVPINFGNISIRKGVLTWKPAELHFVPNWDLDNQWIWSKVAIDTFKPYFPSKDDNVSQVNSIQVHYYEVPHINDRKIIFKFTPTKQKGIETIVKEATNGK